MTGYAEALRDHATFASAVLPKPFKAAELNRRVAEILNEFPSGDRAGGRNTLHWEVAITPVAA
jgi:hypothetical protein